MTRPDPTPRGVACDDGMTLVEVVTASAILLVVLSIVGGFISGVTTAVATMTDKMDIAAQARIAQDRLVRELRMAQSPDETASTATGRAPVLISRTSATLYLLDRSADFSVATPPNLTKVQWSVSATGGQLVRTTWNMTPVGSGTTRRWTQASTTPASSVTIASYLQNSATQPLFADAAIADAAGTAGATPCAVAGAATATETPLTGPGVMVCLVLDRNPATSPTQATYSSRVVLRNPTLSATMPAQLPPRADPSVSAGVTPAQPAGGYAPATGFSVTATVSGAPNTTYQVQSAVFPASWTCAPTTACATSGSDRWIATNVTLDANGSPAAVSVSLTAPTATATCSWFRLTLRLAPVSGTTVANWPVAEAAPLSGYWTCPTAGAQNTVPAGGARVDGASPRGAYA